MKFLFGMIWFCSLSAFAMHGDVKESQRGEYYEFDIEGGRGDKIRREMSYHTIQIIKAPFKIVRKCVHTGKDAVRTGVHGIESFLRDSGGIDIDDPKFRRAMSDFETQAYSYYDLDRNEERPPYTLGKILKNILYTAGFVLPRATWRIVKNSANQIVWICVPR
jgi:hypothetical protein